MPPTQERPEVPPEESPSGHGATPPSVGKSKKRGLIWVVFLLIIAGIAAYAVRHAGDVGSAPKGSGGGGGGAAGPIPVVVTKVTRSSVPLYLSDCLGNVSPYYTVTVKSRVDGQLMQVDFTEGELVKEGQVLAEIDDRPFHIQLDVAQAALAHDQALLNNARRDLSRYQDLIKQNAIPGQTLDTQTALVAQYDATIKQDLANIDSAKLQLVYAKITAPITGVVGLRLVDPGNIVHAGDAGGIVTITQLQPIAVLFTTNEDNLSKLMPTLRAGAHLPVEAYNRDNSKKLASGTLMTPDNQVDSTTGTVKLKAVFDNKDNALYPQQMVNVRVLVDTLSNQLVVPNVAIQYGQQGTFVYVVDDDSKVHLKPVQIGITTATSTSILSGITDGDRVVVDGTDRLIENATVRVRKAGELENPPGYDAGSGGRGGRQGGGRGRSGKGEGRKGRGGGGGQ